MISSGEFPAACGVMVVGWAGELIALGIYLGGSGLAGDDGDVALRLGGGHFQRACLVRQAQQVGARAVTAAMKSLRAWGRRILVWLCSLFFCGHFVISIGCARASEAANGESATLCD